MNSMLRALLIFLVACTPALIAQTVAKPGAKPATSAVLDGGTITNNLYRNKALSFSYKIPEGWVLRTDEMNEREDEPSPSDAQKSASSAGSQVLLAAFSRPPQAKGEDVNSSVLIAAEPQSNYPGLTDTIQYFGPLTEVAKAQGFTEDEEPYQIAIDSKKLVRADFHKDVASRVMRQSTLAMLFHGYAISITVIGGTEDEVEDLIDALSFPPTSK